MKGFFSTAIQVMSKLNAVLVVKHGSLFNLDGKAPSWDWVIDRLDEILTEYETVKKEAS